MGLCLSICLISLIGFMWEGRGGTADLTALKQQHADELETIRASQTPYKVCGTVITETNADIHPNGVIFNANSPNPSFARGSGEICNLTIRRNADGQFPSINLSGDGLKIRVLSNGTEKATIYTDVHGSYGIMDLPGNPADYTIEISDNGKPLKTLKAEDLKAAARGGRLDIKLD